MCPNCNQGADIDVFEAMVENVRPIRMAIFNKISPSFSRHSNLYISLPILNLAMRGAPPAAPGQLTPMCAKMVMRVLGMTKL